MVKASGVVALVVAESCFQNFGFFFFFCGGFCETDEDSQERCVIGIESL